MAGRFAGIGDVRGLGAMVAMEFFKDAERHVPDPELPKALVSKAAEQGLILLSCGMYGNVIRILVPLTATDSQVDEGLSILEKSLAFLTEEVTA